MKLLAKFRDALLLGLLLWLLLMLLLTTGCWLLYQNACNELESMKKVQEHAALQEARTVLINRLSFAERDIHFMATNLILKQFLSNDTINQPLLGEFFSDLMATRRGLFDQMRYLDEQGMEIVRVNNEENKTRLIPTNELQSKADRYYFTRSLALSTGDVYVSPFDLNIEHGQLEQPFKPTLRFSTRAVDANGKARGVLVVNFLGRELLHRLRYIGSANNVQFWLTNQDGAWLIGPKAESEWSFMFPDRQITIFPELYPNAWQAAEETDGARKVELHEKGALLAMSRFTPDADMTHSTGQLHTDPGIYWYLIAHLASDQLAIMKQGIAQRYVLFYLILSLLFAGLSALLASLISYRRQIQKDVAQRERQFHALLESAPDAMVITDAEGCIVMVNAQAESTFGFARVTLLGQPVETLIPERFHNNHVQHRIGYMHAPIARAMGKGRELFARRQDGSEFPVSVALNTLDTQGKRQVICAIRDISETHQNAIVLREALARAAESNRALQVSNRELESFSYSVSHDLRAPLRSVDGFSNILLKSYADRLDDQGRDFLHRMRAASQRMSQLIDDMLMLSRISRAELAKECVDLSALTEATVAQLRESFPDRQVEMVIQPGLEVEADPRLIRIVLDNLLGNAWKFTSKTFEARVEVGGKKCDDSRWEYFIRDNGAGFDMAYSDKLFGAFQRLHNAGEFPGSGIGLATVMRVIHKHGGQVRAEGAVGQGATFWFTLQP